MASLTFHERIANWMGHGLKAVGPVARTTLGVSYGNDINLVLPIEKNYEIGKLFEENPSCFVQIRGVMVWRCGNTRIDGEQLVPKPSSRGDTALGVPNCRKIGLAPCVLVNPQGLHEPTMVRRSASASFTEHVTAVPALIAATLRPISASQAASTSASVASFSPVSTLSHSELASRMRCSTGSS